MLNVIILSVVMLNVVAQHKLTKLLLLLNYSIFHYCNSPGAYVIKLFTSVTIAVTYYNQARKSLLLPP